MELIPERSAATRSAGPNFTEGVWRTDFIGGDGPQGLAAPEELTTGDRWHVEPGVPHWHGPATEEHYLHPPPTRPGQ